MKIIVATANQEKTLRWKGIMQAALPEFDVLTWQAGASAQGARHAVVWSPPDELFQTETQLKSVFNLGAGVDKVLALPSVSDIPVYRLEDAGMAPQMAEYVVHSLASLSRGFGAYSQQQAQSLWAPLPATRYEDWPVGVMGLGKLGGHVAKVLADMGYPVAGWARHPREVPRTHVFHGADGLADFLKRTRVLVNLLPLTPDTSGIINEALLAQLRPNAVVINIARGAHVVDADLLKALDSGHVQAAVLDVFNQEPLPSDHPYWSHPRVRVTPHVAAITLEADAVEQISGRIRALERGESVTGRVSRETGY